MSQQRRRNQIPRQSGTPQSRYKKVRHVKRPKKRPEKCHVIRTRIDHIVLAKTAARMTCAAIKHGVPKAEIDRAVQAKCNVGNPQCDCERALLTLRQVLTISAVVSLLVAISSALVLVPFVVATRLPLIGRVLLRLGGSQAIKQLQDQTATIEGVFVRVRNEVSLIERELAREVLPRP